VEKKGVSYQKEGDRQRRGGEKVKNSGGSIACKKSIRGTRYLYTSSPGDWRGQRRACTEMGGSGRLETCPIDHTDIYYRAGRRLARSP